MTEIDFAYPDPSRGTEDFQETAQPSEAMIAFKPSEPRIPRQAQTKRRKRIGALTEIGLAYPDPSRGTEDFQETAQPSEAMADEDEKAGGRLKASGQMRSRICPSPLGQRRIGR